MLRRFYRREKIREAQENITLARAASIHPGDLEIIREAASISLTQQAFNSASAPDLEGSHLPAAAKWLLALHDLEIRREQLKIRREQMELEKRKLLIDAELKEVGIMYAQGVPKISDIARELLACDPKKTG